MKYLMIMALLVAGCTTANKAQVSLDKGMITQQDVRGALFVKAWGMNRALITESRQKWVNEATISILENAASGNVPQDKAREIIKKLETELGKDEAATSESFAYLAFLMVVGERGDQYLSNVDTYLESRKPMWEHLSRSGATTVDDLKQELKEWEPLIGDLYKSIPITLIKQLPGLQ